MTLHHRDRSLDLEPDEETVLLSRRVVLRRSMVGIVGVGFASLLAACGGDDDDIEDPIVDEPVGDDPLPEDIGTP